MLKIHLVRLSMPFCFVHCCVVLSANQTFFSLERLSRSIPIGQQTCGAHRREKRTDWNREMGVNRVRVPKVNHVEFFMSSLDLRSAILFDCSRASNFLPARVSYSRESRLVLERMSIVSRECFVLLGMFSLAVCFTLESVPFRFLDWMFNFFFPLALCAFGWGQRPLRVRDAIPALDRKSILISITESVVWLTPNLT